MSWTLVAPRIGSVHFSWLKITGWSKCCSSRNVIHFENNRLVGSTVTSNLGQLNHFDCNEKPVGYSRWSRKSRSKLIHYNRKGKKIGYSWSLLGLLYIHRGVITKRGWI